MMLKKGTRLHIGLCRAATELNEFHSEAWVGYGRALTTRSKRLLDVDRPAADNALDLLQKWEKYLDEKKKADPPIEKKEKDAVEELIKELKVEVKDADKKVALMCTSTKHKVVFNMYRL